MKQGWEIKKLGDIAQIKSGKSIDANLISGNSSLYPCFGGNGIRGYVETYRYDGCFPIIGRVGALCGNVHLAHGQFNATEHALIVEIKQENINAEWLTYNLISLKLRDIAKGVAQPVIAASEVAKIAIQIPPLAEQEKIVAELDCLSGIIEKKKQQLKELDALAQSIFYEMFGDPIENNKGWQIQQLGDVCNIICGQDYKSVKDDNGQYPIYGTGGVMGYASQYRCPEHSIIIGRKGNINTPLYVDCKFWNVDTAFGVVPDRDALIPKYFFFFCKNYDFTRHDVSVTIPSLRRADVIKIDVPIPPLTLQQDFASKIEAIEKQKELIKQSIQETETLFNSRMDYYFN